MSPFGAKNVNKDIDFFDQANDRQNALVGDDAFHDSDYYNNNLTNYNHPLMQEYEERMHEDLLITRRRNSFVTDMQKNMSARKNNNR